MYGPGFISYADPGVLEAVADRRIANNWGLTELGDYDALVAPADCALLGKTGWLIAGGEVHRVISVDCESDTDAGQMKARGLLLDTNIESLTHLQGWLILR